VGLLASRQGPNGALLGTLLNSIRHHLTERELHLTLGDLPDESLTDEAYVPRILREWSVDGLLINYIAGIPDKMIELIGRYQIPSVWLNSAKSYVEEDGTLERDVMRATTQEPPGGSEAQRLASTCWAWDNRIDQPIAHYVSL
jgi:DNA-binding LacI/PurR family transcriptional regulator